jgi:hypothetical protein
MARDPAMSAFLECGVLSYGIAKGLNGLGAAMAEVDRKRERDVAIRYSYDLSDARARADELGRMAIASAQRVAALEAENRRLRVALDQRTAALDRMRNRKDS